MLQSVGSWIARIQLYLFQTPKASAATMFAITLLVSLPLALYLRHKHVESDYTKQKPPVALYVAAAFGAALVVGLLTYVMSSLTIGAAKFRCRGLSGQRLQRCIETQRYRAGANAGRASIAMSLARRY